jgi:prepilin-type N-terminal cleavage/methylation domain-containing protein
MKNARNGFTLLEMMLVVAISTIIVFGAFTILQVSNKQLQIIHAKMTLEEGLREALFKMAQEIRQTAYHKIVDFGNGNSLSGNTINFRVPVPSPDESTLVDQNYLPLWAFDINYSLDGNTHQILRTSTDPATNTAQQAVLANNVTSLTFSRPSTISGLVTITAETQQTLSDGTLVPEEPLEVIVRAETRNP